MKSKLPAYWQYEYLRMFSIVRISVNSPSESFYPEVEDIKKRWQEYTELYRKDLHDPDNHDGVITHLEPDILECEVSVMLRKHLYE